MAYDPTNPPVQMARAPGSSGPALWQYTSDDAHTAVDAAGYFANGKDLGMKVGDSMIVVATGDPVTTTVHRVVSVLPAGASISAATLA